MWVIVDTFYSDQTLYFMAMEGEHNVHWSNLKEEAHKFTSEASATRMRDMIRSLDPDYDDSMAVKGYEEA